jgi:bifunctional non-homologous end joining protein LigD
MVKHNFAPCIPTRGTEVPATPEWFHEIKHDGYRLIVYRDGQRVSLLTRNGYDWADRYPLIREAALQMRHTSFALDGEAVLLGVDGVSDFERLHSRQDNDEVQFYAFNVLVCEGDDLRPLPLHLRKTNLARLLRRRASMASISRLRARRHRPGPVPRRLRHGARRLGVEAQGPALSRRAVQRLGKGEEPELARDEPAEGRLRLMGRRASSSP